jgi:tRNA 2-thiouridine synthesizing protein A
MLSEPTETLDVRGKSCPYPIMETGAALRKMNPGDVLEVLVDYMPSVRDGIPKFCNRYGCNFESNEENPSNGNPFWTFYIEKSSKL